ncbi:MAG: chitobiase, partial [Bacteroides thetaiotaomicron]|nr:chitobiase [Bacteroides thetaiotaomicron]
MKKNILIIGLAGVLGTFIALSSCGPDYETEFSVLSLTIPSESQAAIVFPLAGGEHEIEVETNVALDNWTASSNAGWCKLQKHEGKVTVSADENEDYKQRIAEITIAYGHQSFSINVKQFGLEPVIEVEGLTADGMKIVDSKATSLTIPVNTNLNLDVITVPDTCDWVRFNEPEQPKAKKSQKAEKAENTVKKNLTFTLDQNTDTLVRYCTVTLQSSQNYNCVGTLIIKQQPRGYIVDIDESKKEYQVKATGETITIPFKVNGPADAYTYEVEASAREWITPLPATRGMRDASESFIIQPNTVEEERVGHITFRSTDPIEPN